VHDQLPRARSRKSYEKFTIKTAIMNTVHSYTNDQEILDFTAQD